MDTLNLTCTIAGVALVVGGILLAVGGRRDDHDDDADPELPPTGIHL